MREEITKKDILILLLLSALSFAESVTNLFTLLQYYDDGLKNWFYTSLTFLIFPCFLFTVAYIIFHGTRWIRCIYSALCLLGCHPFAAAFLTLEAVFVCVLKKIQGEAITEGTHEHNIVIFANMCAFFAANCGSAPQFIIQLYVMSVQNKSVSNIQIISFVISFLFVLWTFHVMEEDDTNTASKKTEIAIFIARLFLLSSRMLAITYFVVAFKSWTTVVLVAHFFVVKILHRAWRYGRDGNSESDEFTITAFEWLWQFVLDWLGYKTFSWKFDDEISGTENTTKPPKTLELLSTILTVFENITMIFLYYFIFQQFDNWYSLLVTVFVCSFSVVGTILKSFHLKFSLHNQNAVQPQ